MKRSIVVRVRLLILATAVVVVGITGPVVMVSEYVVFRDNFVQNVSSLADVIAFNLRAPIAFDNATEAGNTLEPLVTVASVEAALVLAADGTLLGSYAKGAESGQPDALEALHGPAIQALAARTRVGVLQSRALVQATPVMLDGDAIGTLVVRASLQEIYERLQFQGSILAGLLLLGVAIAYLIGTRMQRSVTAPIQELVRTMSRVSEEKRYDIRLEKREEDEIGALVGGFNEMLAEIASRDRQLADANEHLESEVHERTRELKRANSVLSTTLAEMERAKDAAEAASRAKSAFLATMSHEVRTPINGMLGNTELLLNESLPPKARAYGEIAYRCGEALLDIINDILDFSRIEAGKLELTTSNFDFNRLVSELCASLAPVVAQKNLRLMVAGADELTHLVIGDPGRVRQVLANLITNAMKFTDQGAINVTCRLTGSSDDSVVVRVAVKDTGIGIAAKDQADIFERFAQADGTSERKYGGTGLGLAICRELVKKMGGDIGVESVPNDGSTFWFTLTLGRTDRPVTDDWHSEDAASQVLGHANAQAPFHVDEPCRVLVVDDNDINRDMASRMLEQIGCQVDAVSDGEQAITRVAAERYDLVLMDCQMPGMDGFRATRRIRVEEQQADKRPAFIVALTANAIKGDRDRCLQAGMNDYIAKPFKQRDLAGAVNKALHMKSPLGESPEATEQSPPDCVLDREAIANIRQLDKGSSQDLLAKYIGIFLESAPKLLESIEQSLDQGNDEELTFSAHSLKSESLSLGATRLGDLARLLEERGRAADLAGLQDLVPDLHQELALVQGALHTELQAAS